MEEEKDRAALHAVMLPWLSHGHLSSFLELAKRLSHNNMLVHLCSTPINLVDIKKQIKQDAFPSLKLLELHLPATSSDVDGGGVLGSSPHPQTNKLPPSHLQPALKTAFDLCEPAFSQILEELHPDLLIYDFLQPWAPRAANRLNIPAVLFLTTGAASNAFFFHSLLNPNNKDKFPFPEFEEESNDIMISYTQRILKERVANGISDANRLLECTALSSSFVAIKTLREMESKSMDYLSSLMSKKVVPVGSLVPDTMNEDHETIKKLIQWLSNKERASVLFVSFGSEYFMEEEEIEEISYGLELSEVSFLWVVRFPNHEQEEEEQAPTVEQSKPGGFVKSFGDDKGLLLEGWALQREVLSHPSIGGFLTHCEWSSVMEAMRFGVPIVAMPLLLDQPLNAKLLVHLGVGAEIKGEYDHHLLLNDVDDNNSSTGFTVARRMYKRDEIAKGIKQLFPQGLSALGISSKAKEMAEIMGFKGNQEISFLVEKIALLCTGGNESRVGDVLSSLS